MQVDEVYRFFIRQIMNKGSLIDTRNSTVLRCRNLTMTFESTPLVSLRRTAWKNALREFEWFMSGSSNINDLHEKVRHWWEPWADKRGWIANNYSQQFRKFTATYEYDIEEFDQIQYLQDGIKDHPFSRRNVITTWNTADMASKDTPITNCHGSMIQTFVEPDNSLHMTMYQRSGDIVLGVQHNWIQYWAFLMWLAHHGNRKVGSLSWICGDAHIYQDHFEVANKIKGSKIDQIKTPELIYTPTSKEFLAEDFTLKGKYDTIITEKVNMIV